MQRVKEKETTFKESEKEVSTLVWYNLYSFLCVLLIWSFSLKGLVDDFGEYLLFSKGSYFQYKF